MGTLGSLGAAGEANGRREDAEEEAEADEADMALARGSAAAVSSAEALVKAIIDPPTRVLEVPQLRIGQLIG